MKKQLFRFQPTKLLTQRILTCLTELISRHLTLKTLQQMLDQLESVKQGCHCCDSFSQVCFYLVLNPQSRVFPGAVLYCCAFLLVLNLRAVVTAFVFTWVSVGIIEEAGFVTKVNISCNLNI